jgi:hypothetical protein
MRMNCLRAVAVMSSLSLLVQAGDKSTYQSATLTDLQMVSAASGYVRAGETYCLAVSTESNHFPVALRTHMGFWLRSVRLCCQRHSPGSNQRQQDVSKEAAGRGDENRNHPARAQYSR